MATAYQVLKNTARAGNAIIGAGCYSAVLQHGQPYQSKVIKIANTTDDPWLDYHDCIVKPLNTNFHVPTVNSLYVDHANDYYVATMEELADECYDLDDDDDFCRYSLAQDIHELIIGEITQKEFIRAWKEWQDVLFPWGFGEFFKVTDALIDETDVFTDEDEYEMCNEQPLGEIRKLDIHANNIMYRRGGVVITDPWCNLEVEEHPSMETYIEESADKHISENYYING